MRTVWNIGEKWSAKQGGLTMTEIDKLEGMELAAAVAEARGWFKHRDDTQYAAWFWLDEKGMDQMAVVHYLPHLNIAQAWELDGERWIWRFYEHWWGLEVVVETPSNYVRASADWDDFSTKVHAYATVRCRAFLKAKTAT